MRLSYSRVLIAAVSAAIAGCSDATIPTTPSAPSTLRADRSSHEHTMTVKMMDECDPTTFDAVLGAGACIRNGGLKFDDFIAQVTRMQRAPGWRFNPEQVNLRVGDVLAATNMGGEGHTFTEVEEFGGGIVPLLNTLAGTPEVANECKGLSFADAVRPGATVSEVENEAGDEKYQCCIHPWMRAIVHISAK